MFRKILYINLEKTLEELTISYYKTILKINGLIGCSYVKFQEINRRLNYKFYFEYINFYKSCVSDIPYYYNKILAFKSILITDGDTGIFIETHEKRKKIMIINCKKDKNKKISPETCFLNPPNILGILSYLCSEHNTCKIYKDEERCYFTYKFRDYSLLE